MSTELIKENGEITETEKEIRQKYQIIEKEFLSIFNQLTNRHNNWEVWSDFVTLCACAISNAVDKKHFNEREELYLKIIKKYNTEEQNLFPELMAKIVIALEDNPKQDFLGRMFMLLKIGNRDKGQFFTPYHICDLMARLTISTEEMISMIKEQGYIKVCDPTCGAGATLIAAVNVINEALENTDYNAQNCLVVVGQDIDYNVAMMCYIQLSLLGMYGYIKVGNALTEPIIANDSLDNYWFTPRYCLRRNGMNLFETGDEMKYA